MTLLSTLSCAILLCCNFSANYAIIILTIRKNVTKMSVQTIETESIIMLNLRSGELYSAVNAQKLKVLVLHQAVHGSMQ